MSRSSIESTRTSRQGTRSLALAIVLATQVGSLSLLADGKIFVPRDYKGSVEERSQEAILIFRRGECDENGRVIGAGAFEDLIVKISVEGDGETPSPESLAWVLPFPREPEIAKESATLFKECFEYVEARRRPALPKGDGARWGPAARATDARGVDVLSRKVVGSYETAIVREKETGALTRWLAAEGFQAPGLDDEIVAWYRKKGHVFACLKVSEAAIEKAESVDLHPVRFSFRTGGVDGMYFPMRLTGLQSKPFDVTLYVFFDKWVNDRLSAYGFVHRGFRLLHRDWDTSECEPNAGKQWSSPGDDPYLKGLARMVPDLTRLFRKLHPGARFYLTAIQARDLRPEDVREWRDDLWLFPYYTDTSFVPFDAREGGAAAAAYVLGR